ncbi:MAG TPA: ATP-binding protein, partial [Candidatus Hydrogenedentes bacterium]|nr:ATP-binding protein [Candidatus Hydrogenedentota bacterium]
GVGGVAAAALATAAMVATTVATGGAALPLWLTAGSVAAPLIGPLIATFGKLPLANTESLSRTRTFSDTIGQMSGQGMMGGYARSWNRSTSVSQEMLNKRAEYCERLSDQYIKRLQDGKNLGFWNVGVYLLSRDKYTQLRGRGMLRSLLAGDETHWEPIRALRLNSEAMGQYLTSFNNPQYNLFLYGQQEKDVREAVAGFKRLQSFLSSAGKAARERFEKFAGLGEKEQKSLLEEIRRQPENYTDEEVRQAWETIRKAKLGHPLGPVMGGVSTPMNTAELSIVMNVPREEIQGITIREAAAFGVNYTPSGAPEEQVEIGHIIHKRSVLEDAPFSIGRRALTKHGFICGVTGSGKTNTVMGILRQGSVPFMVIEPAKSEYRQLQGAFPNPRVFTLGNESISPFRLNPFEFCRGVEILTHIDHLKAVFNAAFPMYASMPYLLEEAIVEVYLDKGWELAASTNRYFDVDSVDDATDYYPMLEDLLSKIDQVVERKKYAQELTMDLSAALKARLSSLLCGSKGLMLNTRRSTPMAELLGENVVLELKYIGDDDEKAFVMGLIFSRLYEHRESAQDTSDDLRHITVIEEAHRLLKRVPEVASLETANARGKAVETFANILSEIRAYGEGILVVDQIPAKLTPDVLKNTSLKIVHRILAQDDRDSVGATMTLTPEQNRELPLLRTGEVVVHREDLDKPFMVKVPAVKGGMGGAVTQEALKAAMAAYHQAHASVFHRLPGMEQDPSLRPLLDKLDFRRFDATVYGAIVALSAVFVESGEPELADIMSRTEKVLDTRLRPRSPEERHCAVIWYANRYFCALNEAFPGRFDRVIAAHRAFIDAWHGLAAQRPVNDSLQTYGQAMRGIADTGLGYEPMASWFVAKTGRTQMERKLAELMTAESQIQNHQAVRDYLRKEVVALVLGSPLAEPVYHRIEVALLHFLLYPNPGKDDIIAAYGRVNYGSPMT